MPNHTHKKSFPKPKPRAPGVDVHAISDDDDPPSLPTKVQAKTKGTSVKEMSRSKASSQKRVNKIVFGQEPADVDPLLGGAELQPLGDREIITQKTVSKFGEGAITSVSASYRSSAAPRKPLNVSTRVNSDTDTDPSKKGKKTLATKTSKISNAATSESDSDGDILPLAPAPANSKARRKADPVTEAHPPVSHSSKTRILTGVSTKYNGNNRATVKKPKIAMIPDSDDEAL